MGQNWGVLWSSRTRACRVGAVLGTAGEKATRQTVIGRRWLWAAFAGLFVGVAVSTGGCVSLGGAIGGETGEAVVTPRTVSLGRSGDAAAASSPVVRGDERGVLVFGARRAVYNYTDRNTFDIYLTDLSEADIERWLSADPVTDGAEIGGGQIVHLHVFLWPEAGKSPIDFDASNATITHMVVAPPGVSSGGNEGALGDVVIYSGAGFLLPGGLFSEPGDAWLSAALRRGTVRFRAASEGGRDPIEGGNYDASLRARFDPDAAGRLESLVSVLDAVADREAAPPTIPGTAG